MTHFITNREEINWGNFILFLKSNLKKTLRIAFFSIIIGFFYFFLKPDVFSSKISFYTSYNDTQKNSVFPNFIGQQGGNVSTLDFSVSDFLKSENFLSSIVEKQYDINGKNTSLIDYWGDGYDKIFYLNPLTMIKKINYLLMINNNLSDYEKKSSFAQLELYNSLNYAESRVSGLHTITFNTKDNPELSIKIMKEIYNHILGYSKGVVNVKAREKKEFISSQLVLIKNDLENAEDIKMKFLTKNKDLYNSPNLVLQKTRIERDISLYTQLYFTLSDQLELAKIDEQDSTSPIFLLDTESISHSKLGLSLLDLILVVGLFSFVTANAFILFQERKSLFL